MSCALHDFACIDPRCGFITRDVPVEISAGARAYEVHGRCLLCGGHIEWIPKIGRMSAGNGPTFTPFTTIGPDNKTPVRIESIADLRRVEAESERMARNGEGQIMVWRDYSNDRSNKDASAISKNWTGGKASDPRASDWHDHPTFTPVPTHVGESIGEKAAEPGAENETVKHL